VVTKREKCMKTIDYNELDIISYNHNSGSFAEIDKCIFNGEIYALKLLLMENI
jgi:hypothetical protein